VTFDHDLTAIFYFTPCPPYRQKILLKIDYIAQGNKFILKNPEELENFSRLEPNSKIQRNYII